MLIDSHCHAYMPEFEADRPEVLARASAAGLVAFVVIGYDLPAGRQPGRVAEIATRNACRAFGLPLPGGVA